MKYPHTSEAATPHSNPASKRRSNGPKPHYYQSLSNYSDWHFLPALPTRWPPLMFFQSRLSCFGNANFISFFFLGLVPRVPGSFSFDSRYVCSMNDWSGTFWNIRNIRFDSRVSVWRHVCHQEDSHCHSPSHSACPGSFKCAILHLNILCCCWNKWQLIHILGFIALTDGIRCG